MIEFNYTKEQGRTSISMEQNAENYTEFRRIFPDLDKWLGNVFSGKFSYTLPNILFVKKISESEKSFSVSLFTEKEEYTIYGNSGPKGYICAGSNSRTCRVGETWTRGNDMADGRYEESTVRQIAADIMSIELQRLQLFSKKTEGVGIH